MSSGNCVRCSEDWESVKTLRRSSIAYRRNSRRALPRLGDACPSQWAQAEVDPFVGESFCKRGSQGQTANAAVGNCKSAGTLHRREVVPSLWPAAGKGIKESGFARSSQTTSFA